MKRWFVIWIILVVNAKKRKLKQTVATKRCFFTAGTLLFFSDGTLFDRLLYYMVENQMSFMRRKEVYGKIVGCKDALLIEEVMQSFQNKCTSVLNYLLSLRYLSKNLSKLNIFELMKIKSSYGAMAARGPATTQWTIYFCHRRNPST